MLMHSFIMPSVCLNYVHSKKARNMFQINTFQDYTLSYSGSKVISVLNVVTIFFFIEKEIMTALRKIKSFLSS